MPSRCDLFARDEVQRTCRQSPSACSPLVVAALSTSLVLCRSFLLGPSELLHVLATLGKMVGADQVRLRKVNAIRYAFFNQKTTLKRP